MTTTTCTPTVTRAQRRGPVDVTRFHGDVHDAIEAFGIDVSYAVAMARAAVTITRKRAVWQQRRDES